MTRASTQIGSVGRQAEHGHAADLHPGQGGRVARPGRTTPCACRAGRGRPGSRRAGTARASRRRRSAAGRDLPMTTIVLAESSGRSRRRRRTRRCRPAPGRRRTARTRRRAVEVRDRARRGRVGGQLGVPCRRYAGYDARPATDRRSIDRPPSTTALRLAPRARADRLPRRGAPRARRSSGSAPTPGPPRSTSCTTRPPDRAMGDPAAVRRAARAPSSAPRGGPAPRPRPRPVADVLDEFRDRLAGGQMNA